MSLSVTSVLTTCLLNSLLLIFICFLARRHRVIQKVGPGCMIIIMLMSIIRMFFPFEFWYTYNLRIEDTLQPIMRVLFFDVYSGKIEIEVVDILVTIWCIGIVVSFVISIVSYRRLLHYVSVLPKEKWEDVLKSYHLDTEDYKGIDKIKIAYSKQVKSPCIVGLCHPCLVLPKVHYSEEQFKYIMIHEIMHIHNKDIGWKILIDFLCMVFWWNPVFRYLRKELFQLIEMRNDMEIISGLSEQEIVDYMEALKDTAVQMKKGSVAYGVSFNQSSNAVLKRRLYLIKDKTHFYRIRQAFLCLIVLFFLFLTSAVIIEPYSRERAGEGTPCTSENTFLVTNGDQYDVYIEGEYAITLDSTEGFELGEVKIYNSLEEAQKENE